MIPVPVPRFLAGFGLVIIGVTMLYYGAGMLAGWLELRRRGQNFGSQGASTYGRPHEPAPPGPWFVYFLVPALNESAVIGATVRGLVGGARSHVIVIDDASDDDTGEVAQRAGADDVTVVRRELPAARGGKGEALNAGYRSLRADAARRGLREEHVVVCVMDADGRLSDGALSHVLAEFANEKVGAVQLAVRIRNRERFLTAYQDYLFWSMAAVTQFGRIATGSVSLGGNGQFTRLAALRTLGDEPWSRSLTEDLDLGLRLALRGWEATSAPLASVDQQAVTTVRALVRQRTRWYQGHMAAGRFIPALWGAPDLPHLRSLELIAYLLVPWIVDLPWSLLFYVLISGAAQHFGATMGSDLLGIVLGAGLWYLVSFFPMLLAGFVYYRRDRSVGFDRAMLFAHAMVVMNLLCYLCAWRALARIVRGHTGWVKTEREIEGAANASHEPTRLAPVPLPRA